MSFVGPRPLLVEYLGKYKSSQFQRHDVKPGLTCLGVLKRCNMSWKEQFKYDILYVKNVNFLLDVKLIVYTLYAVALQRGKKGGTWTREKFC
jgi:lipopolysaccharide/colanic/teichoic acid biosynthesis glycosyltransferase